MIYPKVIGGTVPGNEDARPHWAVELGGGGTVLVEHQVGQKKWGGRD